METENGKEETKFNRIREEKFTRGVREGVGKKSGKFGSLILFVREKEFEESPQMG